MCGAPCVFVNAVITIGISLCSCVIVSVSHNVCVVIVLLCLCHIVCVLLLCYCARFSHGSVHISQCNCKTLNTIEHLNIWSAEVGLCFRVGRHVSGLGISVHRTCLPLTCGCFSVSCLFTRVWWVWIHTSITLAFNQI